MGSRPARTTAWIRGNYWARVILQATTCAAAGEYRMPTAAQASIVIRSGQEAESLTFMLVRKVPLKVAVLLPPHPLPLTIWLVNLALFLSL